jgi:hypothetical protein
MKSQFECVPTSAYPAVEFVFHNITPKLMMFLIWKHIHPVVEERV